MHASVDSAPQNAFDKAKEIHSSGINPIALLRALHKCTLNDPMCVSLSKFTILFFVPFFRKNFTLWFLLSGLAWNIYLKNDFYVNSDRFMDIFTSLHLNFGPVGRLFSMWTTFWFAFNYLRYFLLFQFIFVSIQSRSVFVSVLFNLRLNWKYFIIWRVLCGGLSKCNHDYGTNK